MVPVEDDAALLTCVFGKVSRSAIFQSLIRDEEDTAGNGRPTAAKSRVSHLTTGNCHTPPGSPCPGLPALALASLGLPSGTAPRYSNGHTSTRIPGDLYGLLNGSRPWYALERT